MYAGICRSTGSSLSVAFCAASVAPATKKTRNAVVIRMVRLLISSIFC